MNSNPNQSHWQMAGRGSVSARWPALAVYFSIDLNLSAPFELAKPDGQGRAVDNELSRTVRESEARRRRAKTKTVFAQLDFLYFLSLSLWIGASLGCDLGITCKMRHYRATASAIKLVQPPVSSSQAGQWLATCNAANYHRMEQSETCSRPEPEPFDTLLLGACEPAAGQRAPTCAIHTAGRKGYASSPAGANWPGERTKFK